MIDAHIHLLPGVDDGSSSMEQSLAMARQAAADGVRRIICTPHMNAEFSPPDSLDRHASLCAELQAELDRAGIDVRLECGAEWMLTPGLVDIVRERGRLGQSRAFLFEVSLFMPVTAAAGILGDARRAGLRPVLAHPERYPSLSAKDAAVLGSLAERGCILQLTAGSLTGAFGRQVRQCSAAIARNFPESIVISSDAHDTESRTPVLSAGYAALDKISKGLAEQAQKRLEKLVCPEG